MLKHWPILIVLILGIILRIQYLPSGQLMFSYDQARDAFIINGQLLKGHPKLQGPPTSTKDFFHGVLYYYVVAPGYWLGHGSPIAAAIWLAGLNSLGILFIYYWALRLFSRPFLAAVAAFLAAISYEQTQYSIYLANTSLATLTVPLLYFGLWRWMTKRRWGPIITGLGLGLSFQANFFFIYHSVVIATTLLLFRSLITRKNISFFLLAFFLASSTMFISEIKFGFPSRNGPLGLLNHASYADLHISYTTIYDTAVHQFVRLVSLNLLPTYPALITILFVLCYLLFTFFRPRPVWWWPYTLALISFVPPLMVGGISTPYIHAGLGFLVIIFSVYFMRRLPPLLVGLILIAVFSANLSLIKSQNSKGVTDFAIQKTMTLRHELDAVDYMYTEAKLKPFSFNSITAPLYINTAWSYLFNWYGKSKYGYLPYYHGHDQIGSLGDNLSRPPPGIERYFVVIEPSQGIPQDIINHILEEEKGYSTFNHKQQFGEITVQNRSGLHK